MQAERERSTEARGREPPRALEPSHPRAHRGRTTEPARAEQPPGPVDQLRPLPPIALRGTPAHRGLGGRELGDRHAERRARHVVEPDPVAELDARRIAAVLAADAELELRALLAA